MISIEEFIYGYIIGNYNIDPKNIDFLINSFLNHPSTISLMDRDYMEAGFLETAFDNYWLNIRNENINSFLDT
jgi:hypothetical protein